MFGVQSASIVWGGFVQLTLFLITFKFVRDYGDQKVLNVG